MPGGTKYGNRMEACSACPGDYEDPDRTARNRREAEEAAEPDEEFDTNEGEL